MIQEVFLSLSSLLNVNVNVTDVCLASLPPVLGFVSKGISNLCADPTERYLAATNDVKPFLLNFIAKERHDVYLFV